MIEYYPFELHTHTIHSDGGMTPRTLVEKSLERGLCGIAITDHNTISAVDEVVRIGKDKGLTVIKGIEWTTFHGHFTLLGGNSKVDWRDITMENINEKIRQAVEAGDIVNIAHPKRAGSPFCTGCYMEYPIKDMRLITGFEVWSNHKPSYNLTNKNALKEYDRLSAEGYNLACIYGDDWHNAKDNFKQYAITYLGIEGEVNAENALIALRKRRSYISTGIKLRLTLEADGKVYHLGDRINADIINIKGTIDDSGSYCRERAVSADKAVLTGSALREESVCSIQDNAFEIYGINVGEGYLRMEIHGMIEGDYTVLLITSAVFKESL